MSETVHLLWVGDTLTGAYSTFERAQAEADKLAERDHQDISITGSPLDDAPVL